MTHPFRRILVLSALAVLFAQCNDQNNAHVAAPLSDQEFIESIIPAQAFAIDGRKDNVIEAKNGTLVICPKGCFTDANGRVVEDSIQVEIIEALSLDDMILNNLSTTSNGGMLETDGMVHLTARSNNAPLQINKAIPIRFEIPTPDKQPGMMAYRGEVDAQGRINWVDPKPIENYLNTVDLFTLDFLPEGFEAEVIKEMRSAGKKVTSEMVYEMYYQHTIDDFSPLYFPENYSEQSTKVNEPLYNPQKKIVNGAYTADSYDTDVRADSSNVKTVKFQYGIDPAQIKVIRSKEYQKTFIATKEFESRLRVIFNACEDDILELYIRNLNKNLYELDSLAGLQAIDSASRQAFARFQSLRCTNVRQADIYSELLKNHYDAQLAKVKEELAAAAEKRRTALRDEIEQEEQTIAEYRDLLWKREKYRMETYGFNWTDTGWVNVDVGVSPKGWGERKSEQILVTNGKEFDRVYTYLMFTTIKSIYRLNTTDNVQFYPGNATERQMLMPKSGKAVLVCVAYKGAQPYFDLRKFELADAFNYSLTPAPSNIQTIRGALNRYGKYDKENRISEDLKYMDELHKIEERRKARQKENEFRQRLYRLAFPCVAGDVIYAEAPTK